ncbi:hypothetical protein LLE49_06310 [Alicyclobacillus tolerans]|uniref:hypothetical protein n=1 Tax=Alicyclobacillus tolerans TaxID=90970 RepID=UPI001F3F2014|nr:hypothetical protein [Alicyclobacillus tolerans]MCF8564357.1 hypothetical protein [Alicyclobacillus tolerans]
MNISPLPQDKFSILVLGKPCLRFVCKSVVVSSQGAADAKSCESAKWFSQVRGEGIQTAMALAAQDNPVTLAAPFGTDRFGAHAIKALQGTGVNVTDLGPWGRDLSPKVLALMQAMANGTWQWFHASFELWMTGTQPQRVVRELLQMARRLGLYITLDLNVGRLRKELAPPYASGQNSGFRNFLDELFTELLPFPTWVFLRVSDARDLFGTVEPKELDLTLRSAGFLGVSAVVIPDDGVVSGDWTGKSHLRRRSSEEQMGHWIANKVKTLSGT